VSQVSLRLERDSVAVAGEVTLDASQTMVTFTPEAPLAVLTQYTATLSGVSSMSGVPLSEVHSWQFTIRDRRWGTARPIEDRIASASAPRVAMDPQSNAVAVWVQSYGIEPSIWSNRFTPLTDWGDAELIETNNDVPTMGPQAAMGPQVAMDAQGNAVAVWLQQDDAQSPPFSFIWSSRFTPSEGWGTAMMLYLAQGYAEAPQIAMNAQGNWIAVWQAEDSALPAWFIWSSSGDILNDDESAMDHVVNAPHVAMDAQGNALAAWQEWDGTRTGIWFNRFTVSGSWGGPESLENNDGHAASPFVAMDPQGNAVVAWLQTGGTDPGAWAKRFTPPSTWEGAKRIDTGAGATGTPQVVMDAQGNALAVWRQSDGSTWSNRSALTGDWGTPEPVDNIDGAAFRLLLAMNARGNGVAVWFTNDGMDSSIWSNRFTSSGSWGTAELVEDLGGSVYSSPHVAIDPEGNAVAVWAQRKDNAVDVWSNQLR
jgi:hypothetical protein